VEDLLDSIDGLCGEGVIDVVEDETEGEEGDHDEGDQPADPVEDVRGESHQVRGVSEDLQQVKDTSPYQERCRRIQGLLEGAGSIGGGVTLEEDVPGSDKHHEGKGEDVCVAPKNNLVSTETVHLLEILHDEVEATNEQDEFEHDVVDTEHLHGELVEFRVLLLDRLKSLHDRDVQKEVQSEG